MEQKEHKYWAFVSYSHKDKKWGDWLHKALETYRLPKHLVGIDTREGKVPTRLFPIFRDREELPTSADLGSNIQSALSDSKYLIVICSPNSVNSIWVSEEIRSFKALGKENQILCLIVDGEPNDPSNECFPETIKFKLDGEGNTTDTPTEPIAADLRAGKDGKDNAKLKLIAGLTGLGFDALKQRELQRVKKRRTMLAVMSISLASILSMFASQWWFQRQAAELSQAETLGQSANFVIGKGDIPYGVAQLAIVEQANLPELGHFSTALTYWQQRLLPLEQVLSELDDNTIYEWNHHYYLHLNRGRVQRLPYDNIVIASPNYEENHLYVISENSLQEWRVSIYDLGEGTRVSHYQIPTLSHEETRLIQPNNSHQVLLESRSQSSYAGGSYYQLLSLNATNYRPLVGTDGLTQKSIYPSKSCEQFLFSNDESSVTVVTPGQSQTHPMNYYNSETHLEHYSTYFEKQLQDQGSILVYEYDYFIGLDEGHAFTGNWLRDTWSEGCFETVLADFEHYFPQSIPFPYIQDELDLWQVEPRIKAEKQTSYAIELSGLEKHEFPTKSLLTLAKESEWDLSWWDNRAKTLLLAEMSEHNPRLETGINQQLGEGNEFSSLEVHKEYSVIDEQLYIVGWRAAGKYVDKSFCSLSLATFELNSCATIQVAGDGQGEALSGSGQFIIYADLAMVGGSSFHMLQTSSGKDVSPAQRPSWTIDPWGVVFNQHEDRFSFVEFDELWSYKWSTPNNQFELEQKFSITQPGLFNEEVGGRFIKFIDESALVFESVAHVLERKNLETGETLWQHDIVPTLRSADGYDVTIDADNEVAVIHSAKGLHLIELTQGMPLTSPTLYSDLGMSAEHDVEVLFNQEGDLILHSLAQTFTRKKPQLMKDVTVSSNLTAREGKYAQKIVETLPVPLLQMIKASEGADSAL